MSGAGVLGCGMSVPEGVLSNADLEEMLDTTDEWIRTRTGIAERRIASEDESTATLAAEAGARALAGAGLGANDVDLVLVATCTPDHPIPGSAPIVQAKLGAGRAGAMDLNAGCTGFVYGLATAASMVRSGVARHVLLCGADTLSRVTNYEDRTTAILFGDAAGAVVIGPCDSSDAVGPFVFGCDGSKVDWLWIPAGGSARPPSVETVERHEHALQMHGQDVYKHACDRMTQAARDLLGGATPERSGGVDSVDLVVAHQANGRIVRTVAQRLGLRPEQIVDNIASYGNTSAASIPVALAESAASGRLGEGARVLLVAFGAGFSWAAGLLTWGTA